MAELEPDEVVHERVALRARKQMIQAIAWTEFRGAYFRCSGCSWTRDEDAKEKHSGACVLAPFGVAPGSMYTSVEGEPS